MPRQAEKGIVFKRIRGKIVPIKVKGYKQKQTGVYNFRQPSMGKVVKEGAKFTATAAASWAAGMGTIGALEHYNKTFAKAYGKKREIGRALKYGALPAAKLGAKAGFVVGGVLTGAGIITKAISSKKHFIKKKRKYGKA